jgi:hypothetical protein
MAHATVWDDADAERLFLEQEETQQEQEKDDGP